MTEKKAQPDWLGSSQNELFGGHFFDGITELQGLAGLDELKLMSENDGQVSMILACTKNPIKSSQWAVETEEEDELTLKIKSFIEKYFLENPYFNFDQLLDETLSGVEYGCSLHEVQYVVCHDREFGEIPLLIPVLEFRQLDSVERWDIDWRGFNGVHQLQYGDTANPNKSSSVFIPSKDLLHVSFNQRGSLYKGKSILTAAYWHWKYKSTFRKINGIGIEKAAVGTPVGTTPAKVTKTTDPNFVAFKKILANFTAHESSFIIKPSGYELDYYKMPYDPDKTISAIRYEDEQISRSVLFGFLELGSGGGGGSYALGADQSDLALSSIDYIGKKICDKFNRLIKDAVLKNFSIPDSFKIPKLKTYNINHKKGSEWADILTKLSNAGLISKSEATERRIRDAYELPELDDNEYEVKTETTTPAKERTEQDVEAIDDAKDTKLAEEPVALIDNQKEGIQWRELTDSEKHVNFSEINETFDKYNNSIYRTMVNSMNQMAEKTKADVARLMKKHSNNKKQIVKELTVSYSSYEKALASQMSRLAVDAAYTAKQELAKQVTLADSIASIKKDLKFLPKNTSDSLLLQATTQSAKHAKAMEDTIAFEIMNGLDADLGDNQVLYNIEQSLDGYIEGPAVKSAGRTIVSQTYNRGRDGFFFKKENLEKIQAFQYSAVVDSATSDICLSLDKQIFKVEDESSLSYRPPNHHGCRSILVPIGTAEAKPKVTGLSPDPENQSFFKKKVQDARGTKSVSMESIRKSKNL